MRTAEERAAELLGEDVTQSALVAMLRAHEADVRADERAKAVEKLRVYRESVESLSPWTVWEQDELLEDIDKLIAEIDP